MSHLSVFWKPVLCFLNIKTLFNGMQEKESIILVRIGLKNLSHVITVSYHSASLVMPTGHRWDGFLSQPHIHDRMMKPDLSKIERIYNK